MSINYYTQEKGFADSLIISHQKIELISFLNNTSLFESEQIPAIRSSIQNKSKIKSLFNYKEHDPIVIDGNADFLSQAITENWPGDGSQSNPFIIDGYSFSNSSNDFSIDIFNSDVHFQISNCKSSKEGGNGGIRLSNGDNGIIKNNIISNGYLGIQMRDSGDNYCENLLIANNVVQNVTLGIEKSGGAIGINISSNHISNILDSGIKIQHEGFSIYIENNTIETCGSGIEVVGENFEGSVSTHIISNTISSIGEGGIAIEGSWSNNVMNNLIYENEGTGISITSSKGNLLFNNTIYQQIKSSGLLLWSSENNNVTNNFMFNNLGGIALYYSNENDFTKNYVYGNADVSVFLDSSDRNNFTNNLLANSHEGIWIRSSHNNLIKDNLFWNNTAPALLLDYNSSNNIISFNDFTNNSRYPPQAVDNIINSTNTFVYNYWNEWTSPDNDDNGIVDDPYLIDDNQDSYPLTSLDLNLPHLVLAPRIVYPRENDIVNGTVYINWTLSVDSHKHAVSYALYYSTEENQTWIEIKSELIYHYHRWDTTAISNGFTYLIKVVASCGENCASEVVLRQLTIQNKIDETDGILNQLITQITSIFLVVCCTIAVGYYVVNKKYGTPSFTEYFQSDKIEFLRPIYHKVIIGLENITTAIMSDTVVTPLLEEPITPTSLAKWFPTDYRSELKSELKGRTVLTLIEVAFLYAEDVNMTLLAQNLDIPPSTLSGELRKLVSLNYLDFHVSPQVLHDGRFRHYIITPKGISFLKILKSALELSIKRIKEKERSIAI
jgi:parallel beta-helix repeat protein